MRAILIDPVAKTLCEVVYDGNYKSIYGLIDASTFEAMNISHNESIFIDEEGLLHEPSPTHYFKFQNGHPVGGKGLVLGVDDEGESVATKLRLDWLRARILFVRLRFCGFREISGTIDHPILGPNTPMIGHQAVFEPFEEESR